MNEKDLIVGKQPIELSTHCPERRCLNLDEQIAAPDVDDKTLKLHLDLVTAFDEKVFQPPMERAFV